MVCFRIVVNVCMYMCCKYYKCVAINKEKKSHELLISADHKKNSHQIIGLSTPCVRRTFLPQGRIQLSAETRLTWNFGQLHSPVFLSHTVFSAPAPTTAKPTVPVQIPPDCCREMDLSAFNSTRLQSLL